MASARQSLAALRTYFRHNITSLAGEVKFFLQLIFDRLSGIVGTAVMRPYSAGWISSLYLIRWHRNCKVESKSPKHKRNCQFFDSLSTVNCQPSTVNYQTDLILFHVSAVGVPGWVIGQKPKYEQGNKE